MRVLRALLPLVPLFVASACTDSDATSLRIRLALDLSGEVNASALSMPEEATPLESASSGIEWQDRGRILFSAGRFADLNQLVIEDLRFAAEARQDGPSYVRVTLPRGPEARWYQLFTTSDAARRERMARALDPEGRADKIGTSVKLVIETPAPVISTGFHPNVRGAKTDSDAEEASLVLPLDALSSGEGDIVWDVAW